MKLGKMFFIPRVVGNFFMVVRGGGGGERGRGGGS